MKMAAPLSLGSAHWCVWASASVGADADADADAEAEAEAGVIVAAANKTRTNSACIACRAREPRLSLCKVRSIAMVTVLREVPLCKEYVIRNAMQCNSMQHK